jgi:hypothetical protein
MNTQTLTDLQTAALEYVERLGWYIVPVHSVTKGRCSCGDAKCTSQGKHPRLNDWHTASSNALETIRAWGKRWPDGNIGLDTGKSRLIVLDGDGPEALESLRGRHMPPTPQQNTSPGHYQWLFQHPGGTVKNMTRFLPGLDLKADGGQVVVPPSTHYTGHIRAWVLSPYDAEPAPCPDWLRDIIQDNAPRTTPPKSAGRNGHGPAEDSIPDGARNETLASLAGTMRRRGMSEPAILAALQAENLEKCNPPLDDAEVERIAASVARYAPAEDPELDALTKLGYSFRMNDCDDAIEVNGERLTDPLRAKIRKQMRGRGFKQMEALEDTYTAHAYDHRYHPIKERLQALTWDGQSHIAMLAAYFEEKHDGDVFYVWLRRWLIGAVAKVYNAEQTPMLVLDGPQDIGKSYFVSWLASPFPGYFYEGDINTEDKDAYVRLISKVVWEVGELGGTMRRQDREALKFFLTMRTVTVRKAYGRLDTVKPAMCSFIGTINNEGGFLSDPTGNRRFLVCHLTAIDWKYAGQIDAGQAWAEAHAAYLAGEPWRLTDEERKMAREINEEYEVVDPVESLLLKYFKVDPADESSWVASSDIMTVLEANGLRGNSKANYMALAGAMRKLGCSKEKGWTGNGQRVWGYRGVKAPFEG